MPGFNFEGVEGAPFAEKKVGKKKVFEKIAPFLQTSEYGKSAGVCTSPINKGSVS